MATLAESFLEDLDELDDAEDQPTEAAGGAGAGAAELAAALTRGAPTGSVDAVAPLLTTERFQRNMERVEAALQRGGPTSARTGPLEDDPEYQARSRRRLPPGRVHSLPLSAQLIVECNAQTVEVDDEIVAVHAFIRDRYKAKFPELESLVLHPIDYARVVRAIGNEMDPMEVNLDGLLPSATIMVVTVTGSTTNGQPLPEEVLSRTNEACDRALALDEAKRRMLRFVESRMAFIAPNLSAVVGTQVAAQLMGTAGGLAVLSRMPACNVQVLGAKRKALGGLSSAAAARAGELHAGFVHACELVQQTPPALRMRACRLVGAKCTLMARLDAYGEEPSGVAGERMRAECRAKIEKWQEPPPAKIVKPLPVPDLEPKKRRGGRRLRKQKERYGQTDMRKAANRLNFNQPEEEAGLEGVGLGVLGAQGGDGRLRLNATHSKKLQRDASKFTAKKYGTSGATSGLSSSLAFTPIQGIELANPSQARSTLGTGGTDSVFGASRGFSRVSRELKAP